MQLQCICFRADNGPAISTRPWHPSWAAFDSGTNSVHESFSRLRDQTSLPRSYKIEDCKIMEWVWRAGPVDLKSESQVMAAKFPSALLLETTPTHNTCHHLYSFFRASQNSSLSLTISPATQRGWESSIVKKRRWETEEQLAICQSHWVLLSVSMSVCGVPPSFSPFSSLRL